MLLQMRFHRQVKTDLKIKVMKILIDNGHGEETPGKRSPDGLFREYKYARQIAEEVVKQLRLRAMMHSVSSQRITMYLWLRGASV